MKTIKNAILYSAYKHNSTIKWLVGCDPIGTAWDKSISSGYPGAIRDQEPSTDIRLPLSILDHIPVGSCHSL